MGSIATSVITINLIGEVDSINKAARDLFGDKSKSIIGEHYSYFFSKDKNICDAIDSAEHELETISELNSTLLTKSRNTKINYSVAPLKDQKNKHLGMVVAIEDITEQSKINFCVSSNSAVATSFKIFLIFFQEKIMLQSLFLKIY